MNPTFSKISRTTHWISSALGLASLLFFSVTGITLNHPDWFKAAPKVEVSVIQQPDIWLAEFNQASETDQLAAVAKAINHAWHLPVPRNIERDDVEWVLDYQRPGGISTVLLDLTSGVMTLEQVDDGAVALINDLHKGRHAGSAWLLFIDVAAIVCIFFSLTGLFLLFVYAKKRASTWPLVLLGAALPVLLFWVFVP
ncbi:PepSY-associated TM helix domain-containing protein [Simiduia curdlanivorans]|uniref:PepSY-associated TM helix domain-containing protein n=1 Tax=Simiduia curdlanivorans TaxID=1492769 RepID=A0ABV8V2L0_9GAMM|nr:PepSY-associated TM helix domain-containing protein [Simiduia curdlanivorans]MDN3637332.1 PepSY-associated TM helix domain-containing protein [Simiduia curdlanivorans]